MNDCIQLIFNTKFYELRHNFQLVILDSISPRYDSFCCQDCSLVMMLTISILSHLIGYDKIPQLTIQRKLETNNSFKYNDILQKGLQGDTQSSS